jgi:hypothetical protein
MMGAMQLDTARNGAGAGVLATVEAWLAQRELDGVDLVRAEVLRKLAAQLDDPELPSYVVPKASREVTLLLDAMEPAEPRDDAKLARELLAVLA